MSNKTDNQAETLPDTPRQELDLRIQILDYLFERGHKVSKPLVYAAAKFTYDHGQALYEQGKNAGHAAQFAKDREEGVG